MSLLKKVLNRIIGNQQVQIDQYKQKIKEYLPSNPIILEAGACDGADTLQMASLWPNGMIHSFEPIPKLYEQATKTVAARKNVKLYPFALSNQTGSVSLHISSGFSEGSSSLLEPLKHLEVHPEVMFDTVLNVQSYTIDDWAKKYKVGMIDFMWLDIQGLEFQVLNSSPIIFSTLKVLFTEVSLIETYKGVMLYPDFKNWMERHGFKVVMEDLPYKDMGNVLFVKM